MVKKGVRGALGVRMPVEVNNPLEVWELLELLGSRLMSMEGEGERRACE